MLQASYSNLQLGIFARLVAEYRPRYGAEDANFLAVAVVNEALLIKPATKDAENYLKRNMATVRSEAMDLRWNDVVAEAFSYLYASRTLYLTYATGKPISSEALKLGDRATELSLYIPNTYDICGSGDVFTCIRAIAEFSAAWLASAPDLRGSGPKS